MSYLVWKFVQGVLEKAVTIQSFSVLWVPILYEGLLASGDWAEVVGR